MESELESFVQEAAEHGSAWSAQASDLPHGKTLLSLDPPARALLTLEVIKRLDELRGKFASSFSSTDKTWRAAFLLNVLLSNLLRANIPFVERQIDQLLEFVAKDSRYAWIAIPIAGILRAAERFAEQNLLSDSQRAFLQKLLTTRSCKPNTAESRKLALRVNALLSGHNEAQRISLEAGEPWADRAISDLAGMTEASRSTWMSLLDHARGASGSKPTNAWLKQSRLWIEAVGTASFVGTIKSWIALVGKPGAGRPMRGYVGTVLDPTVISESNADVLKGLAWAAGAAGDSSASRALADLAEVCFKKLPIHGARCPRVGNGCLVALNLLPGVGPVGELTRLRSSVKQPSIRAAVEKAIDRSAQTLGVSRDDVEEMSTPNYGLNAEGALSRSLGSFNAELSIKGTRDASLAWRGSSGKTVKSVPAEVRRDHPTELKDLQRLEKDLQKALPAQAQRIERLLVARREWPVDQWRQRYLEHPLLAQLSRRLIWEFLDAGPRLAIWHEGKLIGSDGISFVPPPEVRLRLWHPIDSPPDIVLAWRTWLEQNRIAQPFKQAHREVYVLTDAERQTATYSNRFAAHILRQHQFHALCQARGWQYRLMGAFDSHNTPTLDLPRHDLRVQFWVDQPANDELSPAGINLRIATDQVRFCRRGANDPISLEQIDPLIFSEIMRDIDLFVAVASVGNDPTWQDGGPEGRYRAYWQNYSFGELSATAQTRHAVLESLLPRLTKIRDLCSLTDRFLIVRGDIRTYKIHLGSGNILMEPNDQYLCIVPSRGAGESTGIFLPFEGDATLSIILSKAFMLAEDKKIKDPTITRQIGNR